MRAMFVVAALCILLPGGFLGAGARSSILVIEHVTVTDVSGGPTRTDQTVVISGGTITAVTSSGSTKVPKGAQVVDARGKFLIPGLWDMHTHIAGISAKPAWAKQVLLPLLVANGITGIRDMGGDLEALKAWRREISSGALMGPRIVAAGPMLLPPRRSGSPTTVDPAELRVGTPEEARASVEKLRQLGADFVKIIEVPREAYFAIADESKKVGISFVGHVPSEVNAIEASNAGQ